MEGGRQGRYAVEPLPEPVQRIANRPRATPLLIVLAVLGAAIACVAGRNAIFWYDRVIAGTLIDPGGSVSNIGLPHWAGGKAGLQYPMRLAPLGEEAGPGGSRHWVNRWDAAVESARGRGFLDAVVVDDGAPRIVRLPVHRLGPLAWWLYAGTSLFGGLLYAGAGLIALWARPQGSLARAFTKFAVTSGFFLFSLFEVHTQRSLTAVFYLSYGLMPCSLIVLLLNLPEPVSWLERFPWAERLIEAVGVLLGVSLVVTHWSEGDTRPLQTAATLFAGVAFAIFVAGSAYRYLRSRGEQRNTLRALLLSMLPPYAGVAVWSALTLSGVLTSIPAFLLFPAAIFAPLASVYAFVRYDLWGSRALLSRIGTNLFVGALACSIAIATGTILAVWTGASFRDALAGAAGGGIAAALLVVAALRLSDFTLFRSRAEFKPTIDRLSEDLTALSSPEEVGQAVERTVRRWLACDVIQVQLAHPAPAGQAAVITSEPAERSSSVPDSGAMMRKVVEPPRAPNADLRIDIAFGGTPFGWIDVGVKRSGALFTSDDIDLLRAIANHGGLALAHAWAYQELELRRRQQAEAWRGEREALVETVAAEIAHEIRYPINYFRTLFERSARKVELTEDDIDVGREEVERLERLVSGLKRMASHRIERVPTALSDLALRVETLLRDSLDRRRIETDLGRKVALRCDADKMTQVLANLLSNALEACGPNGRIGVAWRPLEHGGGELMVWDDGPGFVGDPARLFAPWYTTKPRGTGLGLAITHRLVRAHGWSVAAQRHDTRTQFVVTVRAEDVVRDHDHAELATSTTKSASRVA